MAHESTAAGQLDTVMHEQRLFPPRAEFAGRAKIKSLAEYEKLWNEAAADPEKFWGNLAGELHWFKPYTKVLDWNEPFAKWFVGGQTNASFNCLDAHLTTPRRTKKAIIWEGEPGDARTLTYEQLHGEVCKFANALKGLGIRQGDRVSIYMPMVPELAIAMLACAASAPSIRSSSAVFPAKPSPTATTMLKRIWSSRPIRAGAAGNNFRSSKMLIPRSLSHPQ